MNTDFIANRMYHYIRARQLEGTLELGPSVGTSPISIFRIDKGWGIPPEEAWPYDGSGEVWPPEEPPNIDVIGKKNRLGVYQRVRSLEECRHLLAVGHTSIITLPIFEQWFSCKDGKIKMPKNLEFSKGLHCVCIEGFNDKEAELIFANSWGKEWGDRGFGYLPYSYFEQYAVELWTVVDLDDSVPYEISGEIVIRNYGILDPLLRIVHCVEIFDNKNDQYVGWAFAVIREGYLDIEEFFVYPDYRFRTYGIQLSNEIINLSNQINLPIRMWIPEVDTDRDNFYAVEKILKRMNLKYVESEVPWAKYKCISI